MQITNWQLEYDIHHDFPLWILHINLVIRFVTYYRSITSKSHIKLTAVLKIQELDPDEHFKTCTRKCSEM